MKLLDWKNLFSDKEQDSTESATKLQSNNFEDQQETISFNNEGFRALDLPVELSVSFKQNKISGGTSNSGDQGWDCLVSKKIYLILIEETLSLSGSIFKRFSKYIGKTLSFLGQITRDLSVKVSTSLQLNDSVVKSFIKLIQETLTFNGSVLKSLIKQLTETLIFTGQVKRNFTKLINSTLTLTDLIKKDVSTKIEEFLTVTDVFSRVIAYYRTLNESLTLTPNNFFTFLKSIPETSLFTDSVSKFTSMVREQSLSLTGTFTRVVTYFRTLEDSISFVVDSFRSLIINLMETLTLNSKVSKHVSLLFKETQSFLETLSTYLRKYVFATAFLLPLIYKGTVFSTNGKAILLMLTKRTKNSSN